MYCLTGLIPLTNTKPNQEEQAVGWRLQSVVLGGFINARVQSGRHALVPSNDPVWGVSLLMHFLWAGKTRKISLQYLYPLLSHESSEVRICPPLSPVSSTVVRGSPENVH